MSTLLKRAQNWEKDAFFHMEAFPDPRIGHVVVITIWRWGKNDQIPNILSIMLFEIQQ